MASKPRDRARADEARRRGINSSFARRHPERARQERALRKEQAQLRKRDWRASTGGTPETEAKAAHTQQGALARLYQSGAISIEQLACAAEIGAVVEHITRDVHIRTVSLETRIDNNGARDGGFYERLGQVRREVAYTRWREELGERAAIALALIVEDCGLAAAAARYRMGKPRAKTLLVRALDLWGVLLGETCKEIEAADLAAMQAGLM